ncbi:unnamed protein product, partial [Rotaria sp. Silwood2]
MDSSTEYGIPESNKYRQHLTKGEYLPTGSTRKIKLLLQRSLRYSYRKRCCKCCPTILCELLFPIILIALLALIRYGTNVFLKEMNANPESVLRNLNHRICSQNINATTTLSNDLLKKCFKFPSSYSGRGWIAFESEIIFNKINLVFHPMANETQILVKRAKKRLKKMNCNNTKVWSQNINDGNDSYLLQNQEEDTVIIDFGSTINLKNKRNIDYNIMVRQPYTIPKNDPIDMSFISFLNPTLIADRSDIMDNNKYQDLKLPAFTDVKILIDSLLIEYQTNTNIEYELERTPMICTSFRRNLIFENRLSSLIITLVEFIFLIPYFILLTSLIQEKNAKVKEILKVLGIEPILNNFSHAIRTLIILCLLILLLCIVLKQKPNEYFLTVNFHILFLGYLIFSLQLISFCIMIAQLFDKKVRAELTVSIIYLVSSKIYSYTIFWPTSIQYLLIFFCPHIAGYSLFQQAVLHDLAEKDVSLFQSIYRYVPIYFPTLIIMICSCIFYWILSWEWEGDNLIRRIDIGLIEHFLGEYGISLDWNFLFKRDYWRSEKLDHHTQSLPNRDPLLSRKNSTGTTILHVNNLVKQFGPDKIAVDNVSFDLYENQITSLVGPNGSGKTTIFNCLIGIYKQTSGTIKIQNDDGKNFDTRINIEMARKSMGYCPQHNLLFDVLTIKEQIEFYAIARGLEKNKEKIANEMLHLMDLENSKDLYCNKLSDGMKRRLSLAYAFIGDTKIILLDEPSSGLDPSNRRSLWDWLRSMKQGKTLLLTTHFMEESDALSDRIIIITNGNIKADETSAKLKEKYGSGYKLIINKHNNSHTNDIKNELCHYLPELKIEIDIHGGDVVFRTNQQPNQQFVQALHHLETMKRENQIKDYGVQNSTMDDVFFKITKDTCIENDSESISMDTDTL